MTEKYSKSESRISELSKEVEIISKQNDQMKSELSVKNKQQIQALETEND